MSTWSTWARSLRSSRVTVADADAPAGCESIRRHRTRGRAQGHRRTFGARPHSICTGPSVGDDVRVFLAALGPSTRPLLGSRWVRAGHEATREGHLPASLAR